MKQPPPPQRKHIQGVTITQGEGKPKNTGSLERKETKTDNNQEKKAGYFPRPRNSR